MLLREDLKETGFFPSSSLNSWYSSKQESYIHIWVWCSLRVYITFSHTLYSQGSQPWPFACLHKGYKPSLVLSQGYTLLPKTLAHTCLQCCQKSWGTRQYCCQTCGGNPRDQMRGLLLARKAGVLGPEPLPVHPFSPTQRSDSWWKVREILLGSFMLSFRF